MDIWLQFKTFVEIFDSIIVEIWNPENCVRGSIWTYLMSVWGYVPNLLIMINYYKDWKTPPYNLIDASWQETSDRTWESLSWKLKELDRTLHNGDHYSLCYSLSVNISTAWKILILHCEKNHSVSFNSCLRWV